MPYYGVYIPQKSTNGSSVSEVASGDAVDNSTAASDKTTKFIGYGSATSPSPVVFTNKFNALQTLKLNKDARMREFQSIDDARNYAHTGYEVVQTKYNDVKTPTAAAEKPAFSAPTKQKLVLFRNAIVSGDYAFVKSLIWDNPRYLVSSGDTPTSLKEGCRYNALHICAIYNMFEIAELILNTVSDAHFVNLLTGSKNDLDMCSALAVNLLDYYLNIPEKGRLETPLHLASKYGNVEMVKLLTSYPNCRKTRNKERKFPDQIVCTRKSGDIWKDCIRIEDLLRKGFYVPVLGSVNNDKPPEVGQPFSAENPPNLSGTLYTPEMKIQALAGPMEEENAKQFCRRWKTPPRVGSNISSQSANNSFASTPTKSSKSLQECSGFQTPLMHSRSSFEVKPLTPYPKHLYDDKEINCETPERISRSSSFSHLKGSSNGTSLSDKQNGNNSNNVVDSETVDFIRNDYETNNNPQGELSINNVQKLHQDTALTPLRSKALPSIHISHSSPVVFKQREQNVNTSIATEQGFCNSIGFQERHIKITDTEKGLEVIGRKLAKAHWPIIDWCEYWDFLNIFIDISSLEGLQKLENFFEQRIREEEASKKATEAAGYSSVMLDDVCNAFEKIGFHIENINNVTNDSIADNVSNQCTPKTTTPYTYVEKSLQVFAKRMTKTILHNIDNIVSINDAFVCELKRLKSLICSFKNDSRFFNVNFGKVHARFAHLIANYLENSQDAAPDVQTKIKSCLQDVLMSPSKKQLHCVSKKINAFLNNSFERIEPENLKTEPMYEEAWLAEEQCECQWEAHLSRKSSRRNRMETRFKTNQHQAENGEKSPIPIASTASNHEVWRSPASCSDSTDDEENDVFWSDFGGSETEEEDVWMTPPETWLPDELSDEAEDDRYNVFIYGKEPTKRDLDVLNAIFNVNINDTNYPNIYNWKIAVLRHIDDGINTFPSPSAANEMNLKTSIKSDLMHSTPQLPIPKRLFAGPDSSKKQVQQQLMTPLNKVRGLFSTYREYLETSMSSSQASEIDSHDIDFD